MPDNDAVIPRKLVEKVAERYIALYEAEGYDSAKAYLALLRPNRAFRVEVLNAIRTKKAR